MFPDSGNWVKITPSTPLPGASMVLTALCSNLVYCAGSCRALGVVGPYWSQLHDATMTCGLTCPISVGNDERQFVAVVSPKPGIVLRVTST